MNEVDFRNWLSKNGVTGKLQGDCISRLKRIERELNQCDIDEQYRIDKCEHLMKVFLNMGKNEEIKKYPNCNFPVGKYFMSTYRRALKQYIQFLEASIHEK